MIAKVRNSKEQKEVAAGEIVSTMIKSGVKMNITEGKDKNIVSECIHNKDIIFTAHYDTPFITNKKVSLNRLITNYFSVTLLILISIMAYMVYSLIDIFINDGVITGIVVVLFFSLFVFLFIKLAKILPKQINTNNYNDNTSGILGLFEIAKGLSSDEKANVGFIFFDNEEKGLKGSKSFVAKNKLKSSLIINLDCIATKNALDVIHVFTKNDINSKSVVNSALNVYKSSTNNKVVINIWNRLTLILNLMSLNSLLKGYCGGSDFFNFKNYNVLALTRYDLKFLSGYYIPFVHSNYDTKENSSPEEIDRIVQAMVKIVKDFNSKNIKEKN
ncbi:M28 family peptidase [Clostridium tagluense]|uniref:M28 family peptidase n=1 Tax=Clostridium tagluense TaxID=360422 RepID=UPI001CF4DD1B|nr:M28 family peptidase [Clostridium tagluense]MCB2300671.1 M28 family metallopeptidase [Clostridium tagluense]